MLSSQSESRLDEHHSDRTQASSGGTELGQAAIPAHKHSQSQLESPVAEETLPTTMYQSPIFKIVIGPQKIVFTAHQAALSKSAVFRAMCEGPFREGATQEITLPEDDPHLFPYLLDYLYSGDWAPRGEVDFGRVREAEDTKIGESKRQAQLYCMAHLYGLEGMRVAAVRKLKRIGKIPVKSVLSIVQDVYLKTLGSDAIFRDYARGSLDGIVRDINPYSEPWIVEMVKQGGPLAEDLFFAFNIHLPPVDRPAPLLLDLQTTV